MGRSPADHLPAGTEGRVDLRVQRQGTTAGTTLASSELTGQHDKHRGKADRDKAFCSSKLHRPK